MSASISIDRLLADKFNVDVDGSFDFVGTLVDADVDSIDVDSFDEPCDVVDACDSTSNKSSFGSAFGVKFDVVDDVAQTQLYQNNIKM